MKNITHKKSVSYLKVSTARYVTNVKSVSAAYSRISESSTAGDFTRRQRNSQPALFRESVILTSDSRVIGPTRWCCLMTDKNSGHLWPQKDQYSRNNCVRLGLASEISCASHLPSCLPQRELYLSHHWSLFQFYQRYRCVVACDSTTDFPSV